MTSPSSAEFADRLGTAIRRRGLALSRIRDHLGAQGLMVSVATLSYWSSGRSRPTRARSIEIVRALEILLGTEPGWLVDAVPGPPTSSLAEVLDRKELLAAAVDKYGLPLSASWKTLSVHRSAVIDEDGAERSLEHHALMQAVTPDARGYTIVVEGQADQVRARGFGLARPHRTIQVAEDLFVVEYLLESPVPRGTCVLMGDRVDFLGARPREDDSGYALKSVTPDLTLQVTFECPMPKRFRLLSELPGEDEPTVQEDAVMVGADTVQAVLRDAGAGLHLIGWDWE